MQIIDYAFEYAEFAPGMVITNTTPEQQYVEIFYQHVDNGEIISSQWYLIDAQAAKILMVSDDILKQLRHGRVRISVDGHPDVLVTLLEVDTEVPPRPPLQTVCRVVSDIGLRNHRINNASTFYSWPREGPWWQYLGKCNWLYSRASIILQEIFKAIQFRYYYRPDPRIAVLDASTRTSVKCAGHPVGHTNGSNIDICYYTLADSNITQPNYINKPHIVIWDDNDELDTDVFDVDRNGLLFDLILNGKDYKGDLLFPQAVIEVDERIAALYPDMNLRGDPPRQYLHHLHMHLGSLLGV